MNALASSEMLFNEYEASDKIMAHIEAVNMDSMNHYIKKYLDLSKLGMVVVGDINEARTERLLSSYVK
jgi:predicted Zn-dependent peptidase